MCEDPGVVHVSAHLTAEPMAPLTFRANCVSCGDVLSAESIEELTSAMADHTRRAHPGVSAPPTGHAPVGWRCPNCGRANAPWVAQCCSTTPLDLSRVPTSSPLTPDTLGGPD